MLAYPFLEGLPFKIEMNRWGRIEMSPASNQHGLVQVDIATELRHRPGGRVRVECSIQTTDGVRAANVAWISDARLAQYAGATPSPGAPEICVEVMSPTNSWAEMHRKAGLSLQAGAEQAWTVTLHGDKTIIEA